jgi:hypothetical protein
MLLSSAMTALITLRHGPVRMQEGPAFKGGGFADASGGKYSGAGMSTSPPPGDSLRPKVVDLAAAAKSQEGIKEGSAVDDSIAGGFGKVTSIVDNLRVGDGKLAGDLGFDPLQLADSSATLAWYREAEMKHARLAMLAAVGWPIAEKLNGPLSSALGLDSTLVDGRSPTVLNGGLGAVSVVYWLGALGLAAYVENSYIDNQLGKKKDTTYVPGMLGFDPLGGDSPTTRNAEIWSGRVAMVAVVVYALEESLTKAPLLG